MEKGPNPYIFRDHLSRVASSTDGPETTNAFGSSRGIDLQSTEPSNEPVDTVSSTSPRVERGLGTNGKCAERTLVDDGEPSKSLHKTIPGQQSQDPASSSSATAQIYASLEDVHHSAQDQLQIHDAYEVASIDPIHSRTLQQHPLGPTPSFLPNSGSLPTPEASASPEGTLQSKDQTYKCPDCSATFSKKFEKK